MGECADARALPSLFWAAGYNFGRAMVVSEVRSLCSLLVRCGCFMWVGGGLCGEWVGWYAALLGGGVAAILGGCMRPCWGGVYAAV